MKVSCCIPTLNRSDVLARAVRSLLKQMVAPEHFEILILDNSSSDNTRLTVEEIIRENPRYHVRYILEPEPGLLSGRHRGALESNGEILVFVDDDVEVSEGWLRAILEAFEDPVVQLVGGPSLPRYQADPPHWLESFWTTTPYGGRICGALSLLDLGENALEVDPNYIWGLNFAIRRHALFILGGFHPDCVPDALQHFQGDGETGLTMKAHARGFKAVFNPGALVYHFVPASRMTPEYFERRAYYQGVCDSYSRIRREGGVSGARLDVVGTSLYRQARRLIGRSIRRAGQICELGTTKMPAAAQTAANVANDVEVVVLQQCGQRAYKAGFEFHQNAVRRNSELLAWVLRPDYWDYRLPSLRTHGGHAPT